MTPSQQAALAGPHERADPRPLLALASGLRPARLLSPGPVRRALVAGTEGGDAPLAPVTEPENTPAEPPVRDPGPRPLPEGDPAPKVPPERDPGPPKPPVRTD